MNESGAHTTSLFATAMFLLSGGGYATIAACILSACTAIMALLKGKQGIAYTFAFVFIVYLLGLALYYINPMSPEHGLIIIKTARHLGKIAQVIPFVAVLIFLTGLPAQKQHKGIAE